MGITQLKKYREIFFSKEQFNKKILINLSYSLGILANDVTNTP